MKKFVLLCTIVATLACLAYAEYQVNAPGYENAKLRYWQLMEKVGVGSATDVENAELSDLCQVYGFDAPITADPAAEDLLTRMRERENLDAGGPDTLSAVDVPECPWSDTGNFDGDNDCSQISASPYNEVFYRFAPPANGWYQFRARSYTTGVAAMRILRQGPTGGSGICGGALNVCFSSSSVATDCKNPIAAGMEPVTVVTYVGWYLKADSVYFIHVGTSSSTAGLTAAYDFNVWCTPKPTIEEPQLHNTCATAFEVQCNDSLWGDSALWSTPTTWDWYKIIVPDYSPMACSLRVFVGGREMGHYNSGHYPTYTSSYPFSVDGRFSMWRERTGEPCVIDSVVGGYGYDDGCSYDAVRTIVATPGTYYIKVAPDNNYEYVFITSCIEYNPIYACCFIDGSCSDMLAGECALSGGWSKPGIACSSSPCPTDCPGEVLDDEQLNNICGTSVPQVYCDGWYCGVIPMATDSDWYQFVVPEGVCETLWVDIYANDTPSKWPYNQGLDPVVRLFKADCATQLGINYDNSGVDPLPVLDDSRLKYTITTPGTYYIKVSAEYGLVGPYLMHITCTTFECPDLTGDICENPRIIGALPFTESYTTANFTNDYNPTTCLGTYYGTGRDLIYKLTLDGNTCFKCTLATSSSSYASISLWNACPTTTGACIASDYSSPYFLTCLGLEGPLPAGDYYILLDNWPAPDSYTYTLTVSTCDCPNPCPFPSRDSEPANNTCGLTDPDIVCGESLCGYISATTDVDWYKFVIPEGTCDCVWVDVYGNDTQGQWPYGKGLDPIVYLYKADCVTQIGYNDDIGGSPYNDDSRYHPLRCLVAGTYYIKVACYSSYYGPYVLSVTCLQCECPPPCETYTLCGAPGEVEVNNTCPPPVVQPEITCNTTVYGLHCPITDTDFWKVTVAPMSIMTIKVYTGPTCSVNPAVGVLFRYYNDLCASPTTGVATAVVISNLTTDPIVKYLEVYDTGESQALYKVEATCCQVTDYCDYPIVIHNGPFTYADTVNTCCATRAVDSVRSTDCATGTWYKSGPSVMFYFTLSTAGLLDITVGGITMTDVQFMVFTDCENPTTTCWASRDASTPEVINDLSLPAGGYYLAVMVYDGSAPFDNCGQIYVNIVSDVPLPVNLLGDVVATPGNEKVTLSWTTASETENARFEIVRNDHVIGQVEGAGTSTTHHNYTWSEVNLNNNTTYTYTLRSVNVNEYVNELATVEATPSFAAGEVTEYALHQNYPNPFNPTTSIAFDLLASGDVTLKIYNLMGQEVRTIVNGMVPQGRHIISFDAGSLASGIYLYRIEVNGFVSEKKMLLMK